jgi:DNA-binding GntR family transcriptional regulator
VPLYAQLEEIPSAKITVGEWQPGQRIASENELNRANCVSRMTARGVLPGSSRTDCCSAFRARAPS